MRRKLCSAVFGVAALLLGAASASAGGYRGGGYHGGYHGGGHHGGTQVSIGISAPYWPYWWGPGAAWWGGAYWYPGSVWYGGPPWPPPGVVVPPPGPVYVERPPPVYVERPPPAPKAWWYYCPSAEDYYPNVPSCPQPWVKVAPRDE